MNAERLSMKIGSSWLLDSCAVIAHFKDEVILRSLIENAETLYVPLAAYGELHYGALKAKKRSQRVSELEQFLSVITLLRPNKETAEIYGQIRFHLSSAGKPIPENDIWIAATAMQYGLPILTNNKHFKSVDGISVVMMEELNR